MATNPQGEKTKLVLSFKGVATNNPRDITSMDLLHAHKVEPTPGNFADFTTRLNVHSGNQPIAFQPELKKGNTFVPQPASPEKILDNISELLGRVTRR